MLRYLAINQSLPTVSLFYRIFFFENKFTLFIEMNISTFTRTILHIQCNFTICRRASVKKHLLQYILHTIFKPHQFSKLANVRDECAYCYIIYYFQINVFFKDFHLFIYHLIVFSNSTFYSIKNIILPLQPIKQLNACIHKANKNNRI